MIQVLSSALYEEIAKPNQVFIVDLRNAEEYALWQIVGEAAVESINIPYFTFIEDEDESIAQLPIDREITLVCAKGGASEYVGELMAERGFRARNLSGGMLAWSDLYRPIAVKTELADGVALIQFARVAKGCLSYLVGSQGEAIVVDAGRNSEQYVEEALSRGFTIKAVIDTHLHADHISGGRRLAGLTGAPFYLPPADATEVTFAYQPLTSDLSLSVGVTQIQAAGLHSPGHTEGSTSLLVNNQYLLTGDTLFVYSVGRPDLGGKANQLVNDLYETLFQRYAALDDTVEIYPTHYTGPSEFNTAGVCTITLGEARRTNAALQPMTKERFSTLVLTDMPPQPANFDVIRQVNMGRVQPSMEEARELELGPNRCAATK